VLVVRLMNSRFFHRLVVASYFMIGVPSFASTPPRFVGSSEAECAAQFIIALGSGPVNASKALDKLELLKVFQQLTPEMDDQLRSFITDGDSSSMYVLSMTPTSRQIRDVFHNLEQTALSVAVAVDTEKTTGVLPFFVRRGVARIAGYTLAAGSGLALTVSSAGTSRFGIALIVASGLGAVWEAWKGLGDPFRGAAMFDASPELKRQMILTAKTMGGRYTRIRSNFLSELQGGVDRPVAVITEQKADLPNMAVLRKLFPAVEPVDLEPLAGKRVRVKMLLGRAPANVAILAIVGEISR
jgi:hypothetical protein